MRSPTHYRQRIATWTEWLDANRTAKESTREQVQRIVAAYCRVLPEAETAFERLRAVAASDDVATRGLQNRSTAARRRGVGVRRKTINRTQSRRSA
jgi:hypothetical protein